MEGRIYLSRVRLNDQGYESDGTYWGVGQPLYRYSDDTSNDRTLAFGGHVRADDREHAKTILRAKYPAARFFR